MQDKKWVPKRQFSSRCRQHGKHGNAPVEALDPAQESVSALLPCHLHVAS